MWYTSQPPKYGPLMFHRFRDPSEARMNAPLRVPTRTRIRLISHLVMDSRPLAPVLSQPGGGAPQPSG
ncbi:hypothetical protein, partial [Thermoflexus sp.]|uniref:hypothetical protein n=1 Tax=Thermoflexus sp. TaxID=1969742 RepID=UPI0033210D2D